VSYHISTYDTILDVNTTYSTQDSQAINLSQETGSPYFYGKINLAYAEFSVTGIEDVSSLYVRLCIDEAGNHALGEWSSPVIYGISTPATSGSCSWKLDLPWAQYGSSVYAFIRTNAGSVVVTKVSFVTED
jgi:hypothetical protein